jgi:flagellar biogenesis protein FliO
VLLTAILVLGYGVLRWILARRPIAKRTPPISVVATHRLSPRHQLLVVRALGEEHLLSVSGGTTQKIASLPISKIGDDTTAPTKDEAPKPLATVTSLLDRLRLPAKPEAPRLPPEGPFGAHLLRVATAGTNASRRDARSEAVAGLLKLRAQAPAK